ncbi:MAG: RNA polymerase factor sigma-54 [Legionella sp.]
MLQSKLVHKGILYPQLKEAISLLQLSTIDLQKEIERQLAINPLLEESETGYLDNSTVQDNNIQESFIESSASIPKTTNTFNENNYIFDNLHCTKNCLQDHLRWQLELTPLSGLDYSIGIAIIDAINEDGFLTITINDLFNTLRNDDNDLSAADIDTIRHLIQRFDPVGCASLNLTDSLLVQLKQLPANQPYLSIIEAILTDDLALLGQHNYHRLIQKYEISNLDIKHILQTIHQLNPKPGNLVMDSTAEFTTPDLIAKKKNGQWKVILNKKILPSITINNHYASMINATEHSSHDKQYLKQHLQDAHWFLNSIENRHATLLRVANFLVSYQKDFFEQGPAFMKPLTLSEVATAIDMHQSTISRITRQKFIQTPRGMLELKYFFSTRLTKSTGKKYSSTAAQTLIKEFLATEDSSNPFSDQELVDLISNYGIPLARRTVTKYREEMGFPAAYKRKSIQN